MRSWGWYVMGSLLLHGVLLWMGWGGGIHPSRKPMAHSMVGVQLMGAAEVEPTRGGDAPASRTPRSGSKPLGPSPSLPSRPLAPQASPPTHPSTPTLRPVAVTSEGGAVIPPPMGHETPRDTAANGWGASEGAIVAMAGPMQSGNPSPVYPPQSREWGHQGVVRLSVLVLRTGAVADVKVKTSSGHQALDHAALDTVKRWRFTPARTQTGPIDSWVSIPIRFRLTDS